MVRTLSSAPPPEESAVLLTRESSLKNADQNRSQAEVRSALPTLTTQQHRVLNAIENFIGVHGAPPSVRELMRMVGKEKTTTEDHLKRLVALGFICREPGKHRAIRVLVPTAGVVVKDQPNGTIPGLAKAVLRSRGDLPKASGSR